MVCSIGERTLSGVMDAPPLAARPSSALAAGEGRDAPRRRPTRHRDSRRRPRRSASRANAARQAGSRRGKGRERARREPPSHARRQWGRSGRRRPSALQLDPARCRCAPSGSGPAISVPVLVLYGSDTKRLFAASARAVTERVQNARSQEIPGAGHAGLSTHPKRSQRHSPSSSRQRSSRPDRRSSFCLQESGSSSHANPLHSGYF